MQQFEIDTSSGWTEVLLLKNCEMQQVAQIAATMTEKLNIRFSQKINNSDFLYWDFNYEGNELSLHYSVYTGLSIFPLRLKQANERENEAVIKLAGKIGSSGLL